MTHPKLEWPEDYEVPECNLPADSPMRQQGVIVSRVEGGWDIRIGLPMHIQLSDAALGGQPLSERAAEVAKNAGVMLTNDLWIDLVPLIKDKLAEQVEEPTNEG